MQIHAVICTYAVHFPVDQKVTKTKIMAALRKADVAYMCQKVSKLISDNGKGWQVWRITILGSTEFQAQAQRAIEAVEVV